MVFLLKLGQILGCNVIRLAEPAGDRASTASKARPFLAETAISWPVSFNALNLPSNWSLRTAMRYPSFPIGIRKLARFIPGCKSMEIRFWCKADECYPHGKLPLLTLG